jgi:hypothetical protein
MTRLPVPAFDLALLLCFAFSFFSFSFSFSFSSLVPPLFLILSKNAAGDVVAVRAAPRIFPACAKKFSRQTSRKVKLPAKSPGAPRKNYSCAAAASSQWRHGLPAMLYILSCL